MYDEKVWAREHKAAALNLPTRKSPTESDAPTPYTNRERQRERERAKQKCNNRW